MDDIWSDFDKAHGIKLPTASNDIWSDFDKANMAGGKIHDLPAVRAETSPVGQEILGVLSGVLGDAAPRQPLPLLGGEPIPLSLPPVQDKNGQWQPRGMYLPGDAYMVDENRQRDADAKKRELARQAEIAANPATIVDPLRAYSASLLGGLGSAVGQVDNYGTRFYNAALGDPLQAITGNAAFHRQAAEATPFHAMADTVRGGMNAGFVEDQKNNALGEGRFWLGEDPSLLGFLGNVGQVGGSVVPTIAAAMAGGAPAAFGVGGLMGGGGDREQVAQDIDRMYADGTLAQESSIYRDSLAQGMSKDDAYRATREAASNAGGDAGGLVAGIGGLLTGKLLDPATKIARGLGPRLGAAVATGLGLVEEPAEEVGEGVATQFGANLAGGMRKDVTEGWRGNAIGGLIGAGPQAGIAGINAYRDAKADLAKSTLVDMPPIAPPSTPNAARADAPRSNAIDPGLLAAGNAALGDAPIAPPNAPNAAPRSELGGTTPAPVLNIPALDAALGAPAPVLDTAVLDAALGEPPVPSTPVASGADLEALARYFGLGEPQGDGAQVNSALFGEPGTGITAEALGEPQATPAAPSMTEQAGNHEPVKNETRATSSDAGLSDVSAKEPAQPNGGVRALGPVVRGIKSRNESGAPVSETKGGGEAGGGIVSPVHIQHYGKDVDPADLVKMHGVRGRPVYVHKDALADESKSLLPMYVSSGRPNRKDGRHQTIHRGNLRQEGERSTKPGLPYYAATTPTGERPFKTANNARKAVTDNGQNPDDYEIKEHNGGFVAVRKSRGSEGLSVSSIEQSQTPESTVLYQRGAQPSTGESVPQAQHIEPGQPPQVATPTEIGESAATVRQSKVPMRDAKRTLLAQIDEALGKANTDAWPSIPDGDGQAARNKRQAAENERARIAEVSGRVTFDVPGDGKFTVVNNRARIEAFRKQVEAKFKAPAENPIPKPARTSMSDAERAKIMAEAEQVPDGEGNADGHASLREQVEGASDGFSEEGRKQFRETERAYGGRNAYDKAKADGKTKLTFGQWVQVRTAAFKKWFGDWEALRAQQRLDAMTPVKVRVPDDWRGLSHVELRQKMAEALDRLVRDRVEIEHPEIGTIRVGRTGASKSVNTARDPAKSLVAADIEALIPASIYARSEPSRGGDGKDIDGYSTLLAPVDVDGLHLIAAFTVRHQSDGRWYYNAVTLHDGQEKARDSYGRPDQNGSSDAPIAGLANFVRRPLARVNPAEVSKVVDPETGEPLVVYHGTAAADFDAFDDSKTGANDRGLWGRGHYFSASVGGPDSYALRQGDGARLIPAFVSIRNPLVLTTGSDLVTRLPDGRNSRELIGPNLDGAKIKEIAISDGHDGATQIRPNGAIGDLVAYSSNQIKSATANNGEFSTDRNSLLERATTNSGEVSSKLVDAQRNEREAVETSRQLGEQDAQDRGFIEAIQSVLGDQATRVEFVRDYNGLPENLRNGVQRRNAERAEKGLPARTAAVYDPKSQRVFIVTNVVKTADRAVWNALHEIAGHDGLRKLLGPRLDRTLELALQNPSVKALAEAVARERGINMKTQAGRMLAAEEALAELAAAVGSGDFAGIESRYGVRVPEGVRETLGRAIDNFLRRLRTMLNDLFGSNAFTDEDVRSLLEAAWQASKGDSNVDGDARLLESVEDGPFGPIYDGANFSTGIDRLMADKNGEMRDALFHPSIGHAAVIYGKEGTAEDDYEDGYGLAKIAKKHPEVDLHSLADEVLAAGDPVIRGNIAVFDTPRYTVIVKRDWRGNPKNWLLTAFDPKEKPASGSTTIGAATTGAEARSRQDAGTEQSLAQKADRDSMLESVEPFQLHPHTTAAKVIADGRILSVLDAAKAAGLDMSEMIEAVRSKSQSGVEKALDGLLEHLRPKPQRVTGLKNDVTDAEREAMGRSPILHEAAKSNEAALYEAMRALKGDESLGMETVARLGNAGVEGISLADEAVLLVYKVELLNKREAAAKKLGDENASDEAKEAARNAYESAEGQVAALDIAAKNAGREWGRFGQFRQRMLKEDFTFAALESKERARLERPLTLEESAKIKAMAATIAEQQTKIDKLQERLANAESESAYEELIREMKNPKRAKRMESLRRAADDARRRIRAAQDVPSRNRQSGAVMDPTLLYDYAVIGVYHIANGAATFSDWVAAMAADLGEGFRNLRDQHREIFGAAKRASAKPLKANATVAEVLEGIDQSNITPKDVRKLAEAHIGEGKRGEPDVMGAVAQDLGITPAEARALFTKSDPHREPTMSEARQELADLRKVLTLQNEIDRLEAGEPKPAGAPKRADSPAVAAKKKELADLRKRLRPVRDADGRYQEMRGKQIAKRIAELNRRIEARDFVAKPRIPKALNEANQRALFELDKAKEEFIRHQFLESLKERSKFGKALGFVGDTLSLSRAVMTSMDFSGFLRQGGFVVFSRPIMGTKAFIQTFPALFTEKAEHAVMQEIESRPNAHLYRTHKLALTKAGMGTLNKVEEAYAARWLEKVAPVEGQTVRNVLRTGKNLALAPVRGSGRVYSAFLNRLRADAFDALLATATVDPGKPTAKEAQHIARFVNTATGRGRIGGKDDAGSLLNTLAFAPRLVASRFSLATGIPILTAHTSRMKKAIAKEYARTMIGVGVTMSLLAYGLGSDDDDKDAWDRFTLNPRSSDFMKLRFGNTRLDLFMGLSQVMVFMARMAAGETKSADGEVRPLRPQWTLTDLRRSFGDDIPAHKLNDDGTLPFGARDSWDTLTAFARSKAAPATGAAINVMQGTDYLGRPITLAGQAKEMMWPMSFGDIKDAMEEQGIPRGTAMGLLGLLGASIKVYAQDEKKAARDLFRGEDAAKADIKERLTNLPVDEWEAEFDKMKESSHGVMDGLTLATYKRDGAHGKRGELRRNADGSPVIETERISDKEAYTANFRKAMEAEGASYSEIRRTLRENQINHIIPDNVVRKHPLMRAARQMGYDLDSADNLIGLSNRRTPETDRGEKVYHNGSHPKYDAQVVNALDDAMRDLKREYGSPENAPDSKILEAVRRVESDMRDKIERADVPSKKGRLAVLYAAGMRAA